MTLAYTPSKGLPKPRKGNKNGWTPKIPEHLYEQIYERYCNGERPVAIQKSLQLKADKGHIYLLIRQMRDEKTKNFRKLMAMDAEDMMGKYKWLQGELEAMFMDAVNQPDKNYTLKVIKELRGMYEFRMEMAHQLGSGVREHASDFGKDNFLNEIKNLIQTKPLPTQIEQPVPVIALNLPPMQIPETTC